MKEEIMSMDGRENREKEERKGGREREERVCALVEAISKGDWWVNKEECDIPELFISPDFS